ncbi:MAG: cation diffusion facilitator family transporter [Burkholderiales bacterium]|nr:cation diffusion facilitator family transporter [Burkholderiales bacterium]
MDNYSNYLTHGDEQGGKSHDDLHQSNLDHDIHVNPFNNAKQRLQNSKVLFWCLIITFIFSLVEGIGGYVTHSIALQSDAIHMLTDAAGLFIAYIANKISKRAATVNLTFGYGNAEAIGALMNCIFTIILTSVLLFEVIQRFFYHVEVHGVWLFILASIGFIVNGILAFILSKFSNSLNTKTAFIHALGDLLGSFVAIVAGVIIYFTNISLVDPILSLIVITILLISNHNLIKKSIRVLMAGVPEELDYVKIGQAIEDIEGVIGVHDLHIWYMSSNKVALSAHIIAKYPYLWQKSLELCQKMLADKYKIEHITLQYEFKPDYLNMNYCESL